MLRAASMAEAVRERSEAEPWRKGSKSISGISESELILLEA